MTIAKPKTSNLFDTLSAGYRALNRRLWVLLIPVAMDVYLCVSTPLSLAPLVAAQRYRLEATLALFVPPAQQHEWLLRLTHSDARGSLTWLNAVPLLVPRLPRLGGIFADEATSVYGLAGLLVALVLVNITTLLASSLFLTLLAGAVKAEPWSLAGTLRSAASFIVGLCSCLALIIGVAVPMALPFVVLSALLVAALPAAAALVMLAWYVVGFWVYVYVGFAVEALLLNGGGPLRAIYNSVTFVRHNLAGTLGLLLISFVIVAGLGVVWQLLAVNVWGLLAAIIGSAYIGAGLAAARLGFYRERLAALEWNRAAEEMRRQNVGR